MSRVLPWRAMISDSSESAWIWSPITRRIDSELSRASSGSSSTPFLISLRVSSRSRCRSLVAARISRVASAKCLAASATEALISSIRARLASRTASAALRLSEPAVLLRFSKLSITPLVAEAVFSVSMRLTAVARSSAVFSVSEMMRVKERIMPSSSSLRVRRPAARFSSAGRRSSTVVSIWRLTSVRWRVASVSDSLCASKRFTTRATPSRMSRETPDSFSTWLPSSSDESCVDLDRLLDRLAELGGAGRRGSIRS